MEKTSFLENEISKIKDDIRDIKQDYLKKDDLELNKYKIGLTS